MKKKIIPFLLTGTLMISSTGCVKSKAYNAVDETTQDNFGIIEETTNSKTISEEELTISETDISSKPNETMNTTIDDSYTSADVYFVYETDKVENKNDAFFANTAITAGAANEIPTVLEKSPSVVAGMEEPVSEPDIPFVPESVEPATEHISDTETSVNSLLEKYGSYDNYKNCLITAINEIRAKYGYSSLYSDDFYVNDIARRVNELGISVGVTKHWSALDHPQLTGLFRSSESTGYGDVEIFSDADYTAYKMTIEHTEEIITIPENIYIGVSVIPYDKRGHEMLSIVIEAYSEEDYKTKIIGTDCWTSVNSSGSLTQHSIYAK